MLAPGGVFASNTSTLPITGLAAGQRDARSTSSACTSSRRCDKMKLVEIIRGKQTERRDGGPRLRLRASRIGKTPIVVNDSRGFFTSRVFGTFVMEGAAMLGEGIAAPLIEHAGARRPACRSARWRCSTRPRCRCRCTCWTRPAPTSRAEGGTLRRDAGRAAGRAHGQGARPPRPRRRRRLLRLPGRTGAKQPLARAARTCSRSPAPPWDIAGAEGPPAVPPGRSRPRAASPKAC